MPELPEVETIRKALETKLKDEEILDVIVNYEKIIKTSIEDFKNNLKHQFIRKFYRKGKYLILELDDYILIIHLRMEGKFYYGSNLDLKHIHIIFKFKNNNLYYQDVRKFSTVELYNKNINIESIINIGVDANSELIDAQFIKEITKSSKRNIKSILMDQKLLAGIGNIYADEICFRSKIHPASISNKLDIKDCEVLDFNIKSVLNEAIEAGGMSIKDYTSSITGRFSFDTMTHFRDKSKCINCGNKIKKIKLKGRGTYFCDKCQILKI
ncbi:MAG: DNA-formamidopyrimidine glycosylase [Erysipelotrichaceae bacterium]|nr:DNA-formamidopyrimidine glycosylase [Erysipelotrichaceae bacterium]